MAYNKETNMYEGFIYKIYNDVNDKVYIGQTTSTLKERWHGHMSSVLNEKRYTTALCRAMRKYGRDKFHIKEIDKLEYSTKEELIFNLNILEQQRIIDYKSLSCEKGYNIEKGGDNKCVHGRQVCKYDLELNHLSTYESLQEASRQNNIDGATIGAVCAHRMYTAGGYIWAYKEEKPIKPKYFSNSSEFATSSKSKKKQNNTLDAKEQLRLKRLGWNGERIFQYNAYGELINIFNDLIEACEKLNINAQELKKNLNGEKLCFKKSVLRYENSPFNKYPRSQYLQPITLYDLQGNFVSNFESKGEAEKFLGVCSGEITKVLKRGGSCKGYLVSEYGKPLERKLERWEKTVLMCDKNWNVIQEFPTKNDVSKFFNIKDAHRSLNKAINNKTKYRGYYWKLKEEFAVNENSSFLFYKN